MRGVPGHLIAVLVAVAAIGLGEPVFAQGLGVDLDLGGLGGVDVDIGGGKGVDLGVNVGGDEGIDLGVKIGGDKSGLDPGGGLGTVPDDVALSQEEASEAVRAKRALPLDDILLRAQLLTDGDIIDAQLITFRSVLLYALKVLGKGGDVSELYFYARTGLPVEGN